MMPKHKKNAIHSGIGDRQDLFTKAPQSEIAEEDFRYAARLRGKKKHNAEIYPEVGFEYGIHYKGKTLETYNEKPYDFDIHTYPERKMEYDIEERRYLCYDRLWEVKAYFEAEVRRMTVEYAIEWQAKRQYWVQETVDYKVCWKAKGQISETHDYKYAVKWKGQVIKQDLGDMKGLFTNSNANAVRVGAGLGNWHVSGGNVVDVTNTPTFSGIAHKDYLSWSEYEATFDFTPIHENGSPGAKRRSGNSVVAAPGYDDDAIGVVFKLQDKNNFYVMMWENEERAYIQNATRSANNLEGIDINSNAKRSVAGFGSGWPEFTARALEQGAYPPGTLTGSTMNSYESGKGWGKQHRRIYRVVNGKMYRVDTSNKGPANSGSQRSANCKDAGGGQGWDMNKRHSVKVVSMGKRVQIQIKRHNQSGYTTIFDFETAYTNGTFGAMNVSQAVKFHNIIVQEKTTLSGRRPINTSQWETHSGPKKDLGVAKTWLKGSIEHELTKAGLSAGLYSTTTITSMSGETSTPGKGSLQLPGNGSGHIYVTAGTYSVDVGVQGCIPKTGWNSSSEPSKDLGNANSYVRGDPNFKSAVQAAGLNPATITIQEITGSVRDPSKGSISVGTNIIVKANKKRMEEFANGRFPENPNSWFEWDGIGEYEHAPNAGEYVKGNTVSPFAGYDWDDPDVSIVYIGGKVKPDPTVTVSPLHSPRPQNITGWMDDPVSPHSKPITVYSNNPPDAGEIYSIEHIKCGIATICPNHLSKETGLIVIDDVRELFRAEDDAFFNRPDYINKKREYTLLIPNPDLQYEEDPEVPTTMGGCKLPEPEDPEEKVCRPDIDDFFWDGIRLIMWTCQPPVVYTTRHYEANLYAYQGERIYSPLDRFEPPNDWTTYRLIPIEETIEIPYDYIKWVGTEKLEWIPPGTKVRARTTRYFIGRWEGPYKDMNKGIAESTSLIVREIPPAPEYYKDPDTGEPMHHGYDNPHFLLESNSAFKMDSDITMWWKSKPAIHTKNVDRSNANKNAMTGTPIMKALEMNDQIVIKCAEDPRLLDWTSGKYIGYGKVNGKEPLYYDGAGKADMVNVSTRTVYFPDNLVMATLEGPFIDVYIDKDIYAEDVVVNYEIHSDGTMVDFSSEFRDFYYWYTDWYTKWAIDERMYSATKHQVTTIDDTVIGNPAEESTYRKEDTFIESMEVISSNPFVKVWGDTLTADQINQLTGNIQEIDIMAIKDSWIQWDERDDKGDWKFVTESGIDKITNVKNQSGRSAWYNGLHQSETDYEFSFSVQEKASGDDDMYGAIFRFTPGNMSFYSFEMDAYISRGSGGTGVRGMAVYRNIRQLNGTWHKTVLAHLPEGWTFGVSEINRIRIKLDGRNIKVYVNDVMKFDITDTSELWLPSGAWGPLTNSQPKTYFWNMKMFKPAPMPKVYGQVKEARPMPWSPLLHNGYFYFQDEENFLHAQSKVIKATPDSNHQILINPIPQQAGAIIVRDSLKNNLRKVTFFDESYAMTLENTEVFNGNGFASYYLSYKGIDKVTLKVEVNGEPAPYLFNEELSRVEFMYKIGMKDVIQVKYKLLYSYMIDMNHDLDRNQALITLHSNYDTRLMKDMEIIFEEAEDTPYYRANEIKLNPLLNHNHTGFLYVSETGEQNVKSITMNITPKTLEALRDRKILITAKVVDELNNPIPNREVTLYRNNQPVTDPSFNHHTNEAGEVYFYFSPIEFDSDIPSTKIDEYRVECDGQVDRTLLNYYVNDRPTRKYVEIKKSKPVIMGGTNDQATISVIVRDNFFNKITAGAVSIEVTNTAGARSTSTAFIPSSGVLTFDVKGEGETHGSIFVKVSYGMGFEDAANYTYVKVIGG